MASPKPPLSLQPLTIEDLNDDLNILPISESTLQLQVDTLNVLEKRVPLNSFTPDRQRKIKNYYRFSATRMNSNAEVIAKRTNDTLDIV